MCFKLGVMADYCILQQDDIRNYIDTSVKRGYDLSTFRKERIGGDSLGISYWWVNFFSPFFGEKHLKKFHPSDIMYGPC